MESKSLCVPVYLNEKIVFDLLAIIEDGFSQMSEVRTAVSQNSDVVGSLNGGVKGKVFGLFSTNLDAKIDASKQKSNSDEKQEQRIHTATSLFSKLMVKLEEAKLIKDIENGDLKTGDFVQFKGTLKQNPIFELLESFNGIFNILESIGQVNEQMKEVSGVIDGLKNSKNIDLVSELSSEKVKRVILTINENNFTDSVAEAIDGEYYIIGKIVKITSKDKGEKINLLRNTPMGKLGTETLQQFKSQLTSNPDLQQTLDMPEMNFEIEENAIQIIPICIYA